MPATRRNALFSIPRSIVSLSVRSHVGTERSTYPRFDLVTGVSTRSLQAHCALIDTAESLATAGNLYREAATQFALTPDYWFWLRRTGGIVDTTRFRAEIARVISRPSRRGNARALAVVGKKRLELEKRRVGFFFGEIVSARQ